MFHFFQSKKTRQVLFEAELIQGNLRRNRIYSQDTLPARDREALEDLEKQYAPLLKIKDIEGLEKLNHESMKLGNRLFPPSPWDAWRENVEVFVVAAIMALAIRTFFLQPFKIPTGSMEPTLMGIEPTPTTVAPPGIPYQIYAFLIHGRTYSRVVTEHGGRITALKPGSMTIWFEYTDVYLDDSQGNEEVKRIWIRLYDVEMKLNIREGMDYQPGDVLANYVTQTGDQVLVDKVTYNFRPPRMGEVFIFKTAGIPDLEHESGPDQEGSQDFIKRYIGQGGDFIEAKPPFLYVNNKPASGAPAFEKEFERKDGYPGYTLIDFSQCRGITRDPSRLFDPFDHDNDQSYYVPADCYWAMGDNSSNSKDSRYWGGVPRQNLVGRGYFVFWPFTSRWGWIR